MKAQPSLKNRWQNLGLAYSWRPCRRYFPEEAIGLFKCINSYVDDMPGPWYRWLVWPNAAGARHSMAKRAWLERGEINACSL